MSPLSLQILSGEFPAPECARLICLIIVPGECKKAGKILASFVDPRQAFGPDKIIPPEILAGAKVKLPEKKSHRALSY